jgi:hypothetical protein
MTLTHEQAQHILTQAKAVNACVGQYKAAARALKRNDLEGFERICRASHRWLSMHGINYALTDGLAEEFYLTGARGFHGTYKDGGLQGLAEWFYPGGTCSFRCAYKDGKQEGLAEGFHPDGTLSFRCTYKDGKREGLAEWFYADGTLNFQYAYKDGVKQ